jgi:23S rRNA pseudouridine1911/1915/1917 synthase
MEIPILYEDEDVLIINKPAGLLVHADGVSQESTLVDWILEHYPQLAAVGEMAVANNPPLVRPGIVHRLDRDTSGVMLIAKNQKAYLFLKEAFQKHLVHKTYRAIVYGSVVPDEGTIDIPIGRSKTNPHRRVALVLAKHRLGKKVREAITSFKVLERLGNYSYVELYPKTGRTHQIRVHLRSLGHAVVCDALYSPDQICPNGLTRQALHAHSLELTLPNGLATTFVASEPTDLEETLSFLRR